DGAEESGLERQGDEIESPQGAGQLREVIPRAQRHVLQESPEITTEQGANDEINRERENPQRHADHPWDDEIVDGIDPERLQRIDFAERACGAEFNDIRGSGAPQN